MMGPIQQWTNNINFKSYFFVKLYLKSKKCKMLDFFFKFQRNFTNILINNKLDSKYIFSHKSISQIN